MTNAPKRPSFEFNECASNRSPVPDRGLTFVIRTDAAFATAPLRAQIQRHIEHHPDHPLHGKPDLEKRLKTILHAAYQSWGHEVLSAKAQCLDYAKYKIEEPQDKSLHVHFYNAHALTGKAIELAEKLLAQDPAYDPSLPVMYVSLDDMIVKQKEPWADIGFSRVFDREGRQHFGYAGRPGMRPLSEQIEEAAQKLAALSQQYGRKIPVVLLEDNVRHAKMLNWVIGLLDQQGVFDHGELAAIATCFCCAPEEERAAIKQGGKTVPLAIVIDYEESLVDVCTPRDLLLDGFVVEVNGRTTRLPGIFMDVTERFKIHPDKADEFKRRVLDANLEFCRALEDVFGVKLPVSWFRGADAICHITGKDMDTPMSEIIEHLQQQHQQKPANENKEAPIAAPQQAPRLP